MIGLKKSDVAIGHVYIHIKTGNPYLVLEIANTDSEWPQIVVYVDVNRKVWARPIIEFVDKFKKGKEFKYEIDRLTEDEEQK